MHVQAIDAFRIGDLNLSDRVELVDNAGTLLYVPIRERQETSRSPFSRLSRKIEGATYNRSIFKQNELPDRSFVMLGHADVDNLHVMATNHPDWFDGSSKEAFLNREHVFKLAYRVFGRDIIGLFRNVALKGHANLLMLRYFNDVLKDIDFYGKAEKPRYDLLAYKRMRIDHYTHDIALADYNNLDFNFNTAKGNIDDYVPVSTNALSTKSFIEACLRKGGILYLVEVMNMLYGSVLIVTKEVR
jgi:hypothetical protein|nr:MAG TPA: hypothetical protein [Caudoviricetes sp.]